MLDNDRRPGTRGGAVPLSLTLVTVAAAALAVLAVSFGAFSIDPDAHADPYRAGVATMLPESFIVPPDSAAGPARQSPAWMRAGMHMSVERQHGKEDD